MEEALRRRSLMLTGPRRLEWVEEELPLLYPDELLIRTDAGAVSVGAELPQYRGTARSSTPARYPQMTGYESVGRVIACGAEAQRFSLGDRVVAFYGPSPGEKKPPRYSSSGVLRRREENREHYYYNSESKRRQVSQRRFGNSRAGILAEKTTCCCVAPLVLNRALAYTGIGLLVKSTFLDVDSSAITSQ